MGLSAGTRLGPYEILAPLGAGGMGEVYRARDSKLERDVAVKVLPAHLTSNPDALGRFEREAKAVAALSHPNILAIFDFGTHEGVSYAVTELLEGETLRGKLDGSTVTQRQAVDWCLQVAKGLSAAHGKGIVHRDLKPDNVFVSNDGHVKILDFGLAKRVDAAPEDHTNAPTGSGHTEPGTVLGTMGYMSPEQVRGLPVDHRTDLFSFGAILYELLAGRKAFKKDTASDTIAAILKEEPPELVHSGRNISPALDHIVRHCLEKDRENRFQSAKDVAFALSEASSPTTNTSGQHAVTPATTAAGRGKTIGIAAAVLVLLTAAGIFLWKRPRIGASAAATGPRRVAVLPFENLGAAEDDYFADGIADAIRGKLASVPGLEVIARGSSTPYKKTTKTPQEIARELNARYLLTATVRWQKSGAGNRVQVSPELVEIKESEAPATKWQQPFDASLTDVFQVQSDIAAKVVDSLGVALAEKQEKKLTDAPTKNVAAYDAYLKGEEATTAMARADPPAIRKALGYYEQAVALDPKFSEAWARVSTCRILLFTNSMAEPAMARGAMEAARKAIELAPDKPEGADGARHVLPPHRRRSAARARGVPEGRKARPGNSRSAALDRPGRNADGPLGRRDPPLRRGRAPRSQERDQRRQFGPAAALSAALRRSAPGRRSHPGARSGQPLASPAKIAGALCEGDVASARSLVAETSRRIGPTEAVAYLSGGYEWLLDAENFALLRRLTPAAFDNEEALWANAQAWAAWRVGDSAAARAYAEKAIPHFEAQVRSTPKFASAHVYLSGMLAMAGRSDEAIREAVLATELDASPWSGAEMVVNLAQIYMIAGQPDKATATLEHALKIPYYMTPAWLAVDPTYDSLRQNPRFQKLVAPAKS